MNENFRGLRKVVMIDTCEGNGKDIPFRIVHWIFDLDQHGGSFGGLVGKIDSYQNGEIANEAKVNPQSKPVV
jgi:hypothetical protein